MSRTGYSQQELATINNAICDEPSILINDLGLSWEVKNGRIDAVCEVHNGDKAGAFTWYLEGDSLRGNWACRSFGCERTFVNTSIGLVRGILSGRHLRWSKPGDPVVSFGETVEYLLRLYNIGDCKPQSASDAAKKDLRVRYNTYINYNQSKVA